MRNEDKTRIEGDPQNLGSSNGMEDGSAIS